MSSIHPKNVLVFGFNRRQHPLEIRCPGGKLTVTREPHGTVLVRFAADADLVVEQTLDYLAAVRIRHEEDRDAS